MDAIYTRQEQEIIREYEEWKCSPERFGLKREPAIITGAGYEQEPTIIPKGKLENPNWHLHVCDVNHPWFEIPCINPACGKLAVRQVRCPHCHALTDRWSKKERSVLHSPYDVKRAARA